MRRLDGLPKKPRCPPADQRFAAAHMPEPNSGCWLWLRHLNASGYGTFSISGRDVLAHKASLDFSGREPTGPCVLHSCDTPSCVNPDHLFYGTHAENMIDMLRKGRRASTHGEANPRSKLKRDQARSALHDPRSATVIAGELGVSPTLIRLIKKRKCWTSLEAADV